MERGSSLCLYVPTANVPTDKPYQFNSLHHGSFFFRSRRMGVAKISWEGFEAEKADKFLLI